MTTEVLMPGVVARGAPTRVWRRDPVDVKDGAFVFRTGGARAERAGHG